LASRPGPAAAGARFEFQPGEGVGFSLSPWSEIAVSPRSDVIVFTGSEAGRDRLFLRRLDRLETEPLPGTDRAHSPFFLPDGSLGFIQDDQVKRASLTGGPSTAIGKVAWSGGASPTPAGDIVATDPVTNGLVLLPGSGQGPPRLLTQPDSAQREVVHRFGQLLPGGKLVLALIVREGPPRRSSLAAIEVVTGRRHILAADVASGGRYVRGMLLYAAPDQTLMAVPFDPRRPALTGAGGPVARELSVIGHGGMHFDASAATLAYRTSVATDLVVVDRSGAWQALEWSGGGQHHMPRLTPDGRRIAADVGTGGSRDVWMLDLGSGTTLRLTDFGDANDPVWLPDGRAIAFGADGSLPNRTGVYLRPLGSDDPARPLLTGDSVDADEMGPYGWAPDGTLVFRVVRSGGPRGQAVIGALGPGGRRIPLFATTGPTNSAAPSPDGRWLAYVVEEAGQGDVYVRPLRLPGEAARVSTGGGSEPVWSRDGRELFYRTPPQEGGFLVALAVRTEGGVFRIVGRTPLFDASRFVAGQVHANYDVFPEGRRFLMIRPRRSSAFVVVQGWADAVAGAR
jgi:serine/threonine-protein kinase